MDTLAILKANPLGLYLAVAFLGLLVGSFLNVVSLRLPKMMEIAWRQESRELLGLPPAEEPRISLTHPPSRCPHCGYAVRPWQNIPVISWLALKGRCGSCQNGISIQYPLVESITGLLSTVCAIRFGWSLELLAGLVLTWALIALTVIDLRTMLLPDSITLPLLWLGLVLGLESVFTPLPDAVLGAVFGYLTLWMVYHLFKAVTGKEGMGYGDFKLLAALGAWMGWSTLPMIILLSSVVGAVVGIALVVVRRIGHDMPIPFGPYLAGAGWIAFIWGDSLKAAYFSAAGLN